MRGREKEGGRVGGREGGREGGEGEREGGRDKRKINNWRKCLVSTYHLLSGRQAQTDRFASRQMDTSRLLPHCPQDHQRNRSH